MATHEDILLLKLLLEEGMVSYNDIHTPLCAFCKQEMQEINIALWQVVEQSKLVAPEALHQTLEKVRKIIDTICPEKIKLILPQDCQRRDILGKSSLGSLYRADHPEIGVCAIKQFEGLIGKNKKFLRQFLNQLKKGQGIRHINFAAVYAVNIYEGLIIRELASGQSLEDRMAQGLIPFDQAAKIIFQAARGLQAAHEQQLLHKNLKPANIIVAVDGLVKIVDGCLPPTIPHYLSPEQCQKKKSDVRSDIYSLGVIYYQILTGLAPFSGNNAKEIMSRHVKQSYRSMRKINEDIPDAVCAVVDKMLAKAPKDRYQTCGELLDALTPLVDIASLPDLSSTVAVASQAAQLQMPEQSAVAQDKPQEEEGMMHTAMMATLPPSPEVVQHREARRLAQKVIEEMAQQHDSEIKRVCKSGNFREDLASQIAQARQQFVDGAGSEQMSCFDEALEQLQTKISKEIDREKSQRLKPALHRIPGLSEAFEAAAVEDEKSDAMAAAEQSTMEAQAVTEEDEIAANQDDAQPPLEEMAAVAQTDEMVAAEPVTDDSMEDSEMVAEPLDEDEEEGPLQTDTDLNADSGDDEIEEAQLAEDDALSAEAAEFAGIEERVSEAALEAVAVDDKLQSSEWEDTMEAVAVDDSEAGDLPSLPEENDFKSAFDGKPAAPSKRLFSVPDTADIPISKRPIPQQKPASNNAEKIRKQQEEWGPGRTEAEEVEAEGPSLKERLKSGDKKLKPYFERLQEKEED